MFGDIPQAMFPAIVPGSIVGCKGATDPDCIPEPIPEILPGFIPESIPETMPVFNKRNHWQWRLQIAIRQSVFTSTWPQLDNSGLAGIFLTETEMFNNPFCFGDGFTPKRTKKIEKKTNSRSWMWRS